MTSLGRIINHDPRSFTYRTTHTAPTLVKVDGNNVPRQPLYNVVRSAVRGS